MQLIQTKCRNRKRCNLKNVCVNLPLEIHSKTDKVDILIVGEGPGREEENEGLPFVGESGSIERACIKRLTEEFDFSYAITNILKARPRDENGDNRTPTKEEAKRCGDIVKKEIKRHKPKIIVATGRIAHSFLFGVDSFSIYLEEGCVRTAVIDKKKYKVISSLHPAACLRSDPGSAGFVYNALKRAVLYTKGVDFSIPNKFKTVFLTKVSDIKNVLRKMMTSKAPVAVDTEDDNLHRAYDNILFTVQLCNDGKIGYVIPLSHFDSPFSVAQVKKIKSYLRTFFTSKKSKVPYYIFQVPKYDMHQFLRELHILLYNAPIVDTSFNTYLLEENWTRFKKLFPKGFGPYALGNISYKHGFDFYRKSEGVGKSDRANLGNLPIKDWVDYAAADAVVLWNIYESQLKQAKYQGYDKFELMSKNFNSHLVRTLVYTEHCGLPANLEKIRELHSPRTSPLIKETKRIQKKFNSLDSVKKVMKRLRKSSTGYSGTLFSGGPDSDSGSFNLSKKIHRESLFFDVLKLEPLKSAKKKKTESPSTDKNFQEVYKDIKEVKLLTDWNKIKKLQTSYVDNIYNYMNKTTGNPDFYSDVRIRPSFRSDTVTGRLAAQDPNSQQRIGKSSRSASVLSMYEAKPGRVIIKIDYSTFEVRGLGIVSKDKAMLKSFREMNEIKTKFRENPLSLLTKKQKLKIKKAKKKDRPALAYELAFRMLKDKTDFHKRSASTFNRIKVKKVSKKQRKGAKGFVFGSIYGMSINSIARDLGISIEDAKAIYQIFMKAMPEAVQWFSDIEKFGRDNLYVESPIGRRRRLWGYFFTRQQTTQNKMDRLARNSVIQGLCSDLNTIAASLLILYIYKKGKAKYQVPDEDAWMVTNLIHDATELEVPIVDLFKILSFLEDFFTKRLVKALKKEFNFKIKVPLEVDIEIGLDYFNLKKWDGTQKQAKEIIKWVKKLSNKAIV